MLATSPTLTTPTLSGALGGNLDIGSSNAIVIELANAGVTGTTVNKLAKLTGAPSTAVITATSDTNGVIGVVVAGAGTSAKAQIATDGVANCVFDGATTAGDYVQISRITAGDCRDAGSTRPTSGQILGHVLSTNASAGTYAMTVAASGDAVGVPTPSSATVLTSQNTLSITYTDLATSGPAATVTVSSGSALVTVTGQSGSTATGFSCYMAFAVSGATTVAPSDTQAYSNSVGAAGAVAVAFQGSSTYLVTGLTAGSNTFTAKYRAGSGTCTFANRNIIVIPY